MTDEKKATVDEPKPHDEKSPLQSKKFVAYLINEMTWKVLIFVFLWVYRDTLGLFAMTLALTMILTAGAISIGYIINQGAIDKYIRIARITGNVVTQGKDVKNAILDASRGGGQVAEFISDIHPSPESENLPQEEDALPFDAEGTGKEEGT